MQPEPKVTKLEPPKRSILGSLAERYGMEPKTFETTIRATVMPSPHSDEEFAACCLVAHEHKLNPITKEIYFMRTKGGGIQPIVGVDGWVKKCNEHPAFNGIDFEDAQDAKGALSSVKCKIYRKDRDHPTVVTEYLNECKRDTPVWKQMPARMLRHRALIQCARVAFGFAGLMDPDEFSQWQDQYRSDAARDITPMDEFSDIRLGPKRPIELPDIPDELAKQPATVDEKAHIPAEEKPAKQPARTDAEFKDSLVAAFATAKDLDALNEHHLHNETEIEDRGLEQWAREQYEDRKKRIY